MHHHNHTGPAHSAGSLLLSILKDPPTLAPPSPLDSFSSLFSSLIFASLLRNSEKCKQIARDLDPDASGGPNAPPSPADEDDRSSLVQRVVGNLMLAQREHAQRVGNPEAAREWDRVMVGYLVLLCVWLWESPLTAKEFLSEGTNLQVVSFSASVTLSGQMRMLKMVDGPAHRTDNASVRGGFTGSRSLCFPFGYLL